MSRTFPTAHIQEPHFPRRFFTSSRALRINPEDQERYEHICDFIGKTVGVVSGMAAERDVTSRAPDGVIV